MGSKAFMLLLIGVLVLGGSIGGAFAGGMALGKRQGQEAAQKTQQTQSPLGSGQQPQGQFNQEQLQQFQGQAGQGGSQSMSGRSGLTGTIEKVEGNTVTVNTAQGPLMATIGADTTIQISVEGTLEDLTTGTQVTVMGQRGTDGTITAVSILVNPGGMGGSMGGGFFGDRQQPQQESP